MSECIAITTGEIISSQPSTAINAKSKCLNVKDGDTHQFILRVVAKHDITASTNKQCEIRINNQAMDATAYQSANGNESVFVTKTAPNVTHNRISVQCNDKESKITSVGLFHDELHYGSELYRNSFMSFLSKSQ